MKRLLSVRDRGMIVLERALRNISRDEGYNNTVRDVRRCNALILQANQCEIHLQQGRSFTEAVSSRGGHNLVAELLQVNLVFFTSAPYGDQDSAFNGMWMDIQKIVDRCPYDDDPPEPFNPFMVDPWHPTGCREFRTETLGSMPRISDADTTAVVGVGGVGLRYKYVRGKPYLWDDQDNPVEIEVGDT